MAGRDGFELIELATTSDQYERRYKTRFIDRLGDGKDGTVFMSEAGQAVRFLIDEPVYRRELRAYQILRQDDEWI